MNKIVSNLLKSGLKCNTNEVFVRHLRSYVRKGVDEPKYLDYLKPQIPYYPLINVQVRGYDYVVLESYGKFLHNLMNKLGVNVVKYWCSPLQSLRYDSLRPESEVTDSQFTLNIYERSLQIENLSAKMAPVLLEIVLSSLPAGVHMSAEEHDPSVHEESRYIPDLQLAAFKSELQELKGNMSDDIEDPKKAKK
ncbi:unnamed protein product [Medioppia subpectinata]|uniref:Small ribosomal subunit protein uS10 domain-containing protein n=1 Tax=Medioppia subpectinata TaxID=1979941 RepID=A0A7R9Q8L0_9ACAR|nr:unnamed protein product [Medioppia subpectinata]CAG2115461.1 unnamed protein product [Medioppia subpectinata]